MKTGQKSSTDGGRIMPLSGWVTSTERSIPYHQQRYRNNKIWVCAHMYVRSRISSDSKEPTGVASRPHCLRFARRLPQHVERRETRIAHTRWCTISSYYTLSVVASKPWVSAISYTLHSRPNTALALDQPPYTRQTCTAVAHRQQSAVVSPSCRSLG